MIHLIAQDGSENFESLGKFFQVKRFYGFREYENYLDKYNDLDFIVPLAIVSEEKISHRSIYNLVSQKNYKYKIQQTPVLVIKDKLEGYEFDYLQNKVIDDYIASETRIEDLVERIRFMLTYRREINQELENEEKQVRKIPTAQRILRRTLELTFSTIILTLLAPLFLVVTLLIKLESRGPVFYISYRAGNGYKIFKIFKFRTMVDKADKMLDDYQDLNQYNQGSEDNDAAFVKIDNDPRVTKLGAFLRKTSIDELPQLLNVLTGDMSLIGNRPLPLYEATKLTKDRYALRFSAPAGITGLWQVSKRGKDDMSEEERIKLDVEYAKRYNLMSDMKIFFKTFPALLQDNAV